KMGFIETPYRKVENGKVKVKEDVIFLTAEEEDTFNIAQANVKMSASGEIQDEKIKARFEGDFPVVEPSEIRYMDVAPNQIVSIAASMIPFLEHDDANRALMGSNMQRQAVPLVRPEAPIVGTGLEAKIALDSRALVMAEGSGVIDFVDATKIVVKYDVSEEESLVRFDDEFKTYDLIKFRRTNQDTCINLTPIVHKGDKV
ncbi:MAG: DNA-directed RNA polymerase subunit beta, partial [Saprospiraceae bacterium]|nr:DNA-directed RNA polymerase subunit beta [Saprospiraceae bacterium]